MVALSEMLIVQCEVTADVSTICFVRTIAQKNLPRRLAKRTSLGELAYECSPRKIHIDTNPYMPTVEKLL